MGTMMLILLAIFVTGYTFHISKIQFKDKNKLGGIATIILSLVALVSPMVYLYVK